MYFFDNSTGLSQWNRPKLSDDEGSVSNGLDISVDGYKGRGLRNNRENQSRKITSQSSAVSYFVDKVPSYGGLCSSIVLSSLQYASPKLIYS